MGRIIVHLHGRASDSKMNSLIEDYSARLKSKVRIEIHNSKLSGQEYLTKLPSNAILLDEGGEMMTSVDFSKRFDEWTISSDDVQFHKPNPFPYLKAMQLSGIKNDKSIVFEDSSPGLRSALAAKLPTIYIPSNIPAVIDSDIDFNCFIDNLGDDSYKANVIKGPKLDNHYVDCSYLEKFLLTP